VIRNNKFVKNRPVGGELFHADERADTTKLTVTFRNFANAPKIYPPTPHTLYASPNARVAYRILRGINNNCQTASKFPARLPLSLSSVVTQERGSCTRGYASRYRDKRQVSIFVTSTSEVMSAFEETMANFADPYVLFRSIANGPRS
jgi:hypothetical protein